MRLVPIWFSRRAGRRRATRPAALLALVLLAVPLAGAACSSGGDRPKLVVYSGRTEELIQPLLDRFRDETGIAVEVKYGDSADLALLIDQEGDRSPADVFISQSPGATGFLAGADRLRPLPEEVTSQVAPAYRAADGTWVGLSGRVRTLVYNKNLVDPATLPRSVLDLTDPAYKGKVAVAPQNGSFQDFVSAMRVQLGDERTADWLRGMAANQSPVFANNTAIVAAVGRGEVPMGLVNHYYNVRAQAEDPNVASVNYFFPDGDIGSLLLVTAASVLRTSAESDDAERLVRFLLSEDSQRYFAEKTQEYPLAGGVAPPASLPPLASLDVDTVDFGQLGAEFRSTIQMIKDSGIER
ncbi:iron ABC transporter substrate-binding protein [Rhabdothermincola sediminis]|uniref:iron ABC transporter substrate-binding protein n=1 Tax=Rhabdothermincola sediminis TaxID=2751370 RepID=UPI001AA06236|nr:iron ABC transporter substrate-binding protein [Rhabdothermincola sediminis]